MEKVVLGIFLFSIALSDQAYAKNCNGIFELYYLEVDKKNKTSSFILFDDVIKKGSSNIGSVYVKKIGLESSDSLKVTFKGNGKLNYKEFSFKESKTKPFIKVLGLKLKRFIHTYASFPGVLHYTFLKKNKVICMEEQKMKDFEADYEYDITKDNWESKE